MSFLGEIRRRKIFQVAAVYAVVAWLLIQIVATVEEPLNLPGWFDTMVIVLLAVGFPITLIMSWGFNVTAEGLVREGGSEAAVGARPRRGIEYVLIGLVVVAVVWLVYRVEFAEPETVAASSAPKESVAEDVSAEASTDVLANSIAVLPFENLSLDPEDAFFAAGIHESTLNQLAKIRDLAVMSRSSVMQYAENRPSIREIARELGVETVMEGSVRYAEGRVLITAQLIDGGTDTHVWSDEFDRELTDVFAVQAEVAKQIANAMQIELLPEEQARIERQSTESAEAYEHYLHALSLPDSFLFPEYWPAYVDSLERAIQADPDFADAHSALAFGYYMQANRAAAIENAQNAIDLDPTVAQAHWLLGILYANYHARQTEAREALLRASDLSSNDPRSLLESGRHIGEQSGDWAHAMRLGERAVSVDRNNAELRSLLGLIYIRAGELGKAVTSLQEAMRLNPGNYLSYLDLATAKYLGGDHDAARQHLDRALQLKAPGVAFRVGYVAYLYGLLGHPDEAERILVEQEKLRQESERQNWRPLGWAILGTRDKERALRAWTSAVDGYLQRDEPLSIGRMSRFRDNWLNDPMLEEPEFLELRRRLGYEG